MLPSDSRRRPALEAAPADVPAREGSWRLEGIPADVVFGDGQEHHAIIVARWELEDGTPVIQLQWDDPVTETWTEFFVFDGQKVREV